MRIKMNDLTKNNLNKVNNSEINRRDFLKTSCTTAISVTTIASGVSLTAFAQNSVTDDQGVTNQKRWGMLVDTNKLTQEDSQAMVTACKKENGWGNEVYSDDLQKPQWIRPVRIQDKATKKITDLVLMCQHCESPPCVDVCPTNASMKREDGIVLVDAHRCIGCRYCMLACPYDARSFAHEALSDQKPYRPRGKGTVESCTLCVHRVDNGEQPACVEACKSGAVVFGDLYDSNSTISKRLKTQSSTQIRADLNLNTGVRYTDI